MKNYFADNEFRRFPEDPTPIQAYLKSKLRDSLNVIREEIGSPIIITDCFRSVARYRAMKQKYNPSATSDHFWNQAIPVFKNSDRERFGTHFTMSAGAVDWVAPGLDMPEVFDRVLSLAVDEKIEVGQLILERGRSGYWIHMSNPRALIYRYDILKAAGAIKNRFLKSDDNGKTYKKI